MTKEKKKEKERESISIFANWMGKSSPIDIDAIFYTIYKFDMNLTWI